MVHKLWLRQFFMVNSSGLNDMISLRLAYPKSYLTPTVNMHRTPYAELETKKQTMHTSFCLPDPSEVSTQIKSH